MRVLMLVLLSTCIFFYGCSKSQLVKREDKKSIDLGFPNLNEGKLHNDVLSILIQNWQPKSEGLEEDIQQAKSILRVNSADFLIANSFDYEEFGKQFYVLNKSVGNPLESIINNDILIRLGVSKDLNSEVISFINRFRSISGSEKVSDLESLMLEHYFENSIYLNEKEKILYGTLVDVAIHSAEFWFPLELGGKNNFEVFRKKIQNSNSHETVTLRGFWSDIVLADAGGAVTAAALSIVNSGGAAVVPNPLFGGMPTAGVAGIVGGAWASLSKAL